MPGLIIGIIIAAIVVILVFVFIGIYKRTGRFEKPDQECLGTNRCPA
jgi:uncharacterized membrane protein